MNKVVNIKNRNSLKDATQVLKKGGILIFPTDTVYGIGCALHKTAVRKLYKIKNRSVHQPTAVLMTKNQVPINKNSALIKLIPKSFWTGKVTVIFNAKLFNYQFPKIILGDEKIGIRLPKYSWLEKLIDEVGPIVATSANKKGERPPKNFTEISPQLIREADLTIKSDENLSGVPSSVYDLEHDLIIRE